MDHFAGAALSAGAALGAGALDGAGDAVADVSLGVCAGVLSPPQATRRTATTRSFFMRIPP